jgi:hypothetical protein
MTVTLFCSKKYLVTLAVCARALSCWNIRFWRRMLHNMGMKNLINVSGSCHTIASTWTNIWKTTGPSFLNSPMPPHTMMFSPPQESLSTTQSSEYSSIRLRHTLFLPAAVEMQ